MWSTKCFVLFGTGLLLGSTCTFLYDFVAGKVELITGVPRKTFKSLPGMLSSFRDYSNMAHAHGWPIWPVTAFWYTLSAMMLFGFLLFACLHYQAAGGTP